MSRLIRLVFFVLLCFSSSLAHNRTKCLSISNKPSIVRPTAIDWNPVEFKHYPFIITFDNCSGSCNFLSPKLCVPKETKDINV